MNKFVKETKASTAMLTAIMMSALIPAAGGALDYTNAMSKKNELQRAIDATALTAIAQPGLTTEERQAFAENYLSKLSICVEADCSNVKANYDGETLSITGDIGVKTYVLGIGGIDTIPVAVGTKAVLGSDSKPVEIMMVLDYSGSMDWGPHAHKTKYNADAGEKRYITMSRAAKSFIDQIDDRDVNGSMVGVVPFSEYVLTPMKGRYLYDLQTESDLSSHDNLMACVSNRKYPHSIRSATPNTSSTGQIWPTVSYAAGGTYSPNVGTPRTMSISTGMFSSAVLEYVDTNTSNSTTKPTYSKGSLFSPDTLNGHNEFRMRWLTGGGLFGSLPKLINELPWSGSGITGTNYANASTWNASDEGLFVSTVQTALLAEGLGEECAIYANNEMWSVPLTDDFTTLKSKIEVMKPVGATNIALGLDLGWHGLTSNAPFEQGADEGTKKALILLTDGVQTVAAHGAANKFSVDAAIDVVARNCEAIKDDGIAVFSVVFGELDSNTTTLMENCASEETYYYQTNETSKLDGIFDDIFKQATGGRPRIAF